MPGGDSRNDELDSLLAKEQPRNRRGKRPSVRPCLRPAPHSRGRRQCIAGVSRASFASPSVKPSIAGIFRSRAGFDPKMWSCETITPPRAARPRSLIVLSPIAVGSPSSVHRYAAGSTNSFVRGAVIVGAFVGAATVMNLLAFDPGGSGSAILRVLAAPPAGD